MSLKVVTGLDTDDLLTAAQFKNFIIDAPDSEDTEIQAAVSSAVHDLEQYTGRAYGARTYDLVLDRFPAGVICLPMPPLTSVTSVKYTDSSDVEQTLVDGTDYNVYGINLTGLNNLNTYGGYIEAEDGWPSDVKDAAESVVIRFVAGYDTPNIIPPQAISAAKIRANKYYSFKGGTYDMEADKLFWETIQPLIVHSFV